LAVDNTLGNSLFASTEDTEDRTRTGAIAVFHKSHYFLASARLEHFNRDLVVEEAPAMITQVLLHGCSADE